MTIDKLLDPMTDKDLDSKAREWALKYINEKIQAEPDFAHIFSTPEFLEICMDSYIFGAKIGLRVRQARQWAIAGWSIAILSMLGWIFK